MVATGLAEAGGRQVAAWLEERLVAGLRLL